MIGRFTPQKDHAALLRALAGQSHLGWDLDLIGDGPRRADIVALATALGVADRVHFLGARNDVTAILGRADIYALVSHWEGFPRSILEAMRAGLPVVASDVGGVAEAVQPGKTGFLVPADDGQVLAARLELLIKDRQLRQALGSAGRRSYDENFHFELMFDHTMDVYKSIIDKMNSKLA